MTAPSQNAFVTDLAGDVRVVWQRSGPMRIKLRSSCEFVLRAYLDLQNTHKNGPYTAHDLFWDVGPMF